MIYKEFQNSKSLMDFLIQISPSDWNGKTIQLRGIKPASYKKAANSLFTLWRDEKNKIKSNILRRPVTCSIEDVNVMKNEGLVKLVGNNIEITQKGAEVLRTMILGDDKSAFEDDGSVVDYEVALANTKPRRMMKKGKTASFDQKPIKATKNWYLKLL